MTKIYYIIWIIKYIQAIHIKYNSTFFLMLNIYIYILYLSAVVALYEKNPPILVNYLNMCL